MKKNILLALSLLILRQPAFTQGLTISGDQEQLQGLWLRDCEQRVIRSEKFEHEKVTFTESTYSDALCKAPVIQLINEGTFTLPAAGQMDFKFTSLRVQINSEAIIDDFNRRAVCGFQDWKLNEEKEISGRLCEIIYAGSPQRIPAAGDMRYGIYRLEDGYLYLGMLTREENALTPEKRPTNYDPRYYTRAPQSR